MHKQEADNKKLDKLVIAGKESAFQIEEKKKRIAKLSLVNRELAKKERELEKSLKEVSDYKYALDESSIITITDPKGIIRQVNENFCKISKYSSGELIGQDHRIINSGYHPKSYIKNLWITLASGKIWTGEFCNKAKDGSIYWIDTSIVPFFNKKGKPYQHLAILSDITERKKIEKDLRESGFALNESQRIAHVGSWFLDLAAPGEVIGKMIWSEETYKVYGVSPDNFTPTLESFLSLIHPDDRSLIQIWLNAFFIGENPGESEFRILLPGGAIRFLCGRGEINYDNQHQPCLVSGTMQDITERKIAQRQIIKERNLSDSIINGLPGIFFLFDSTGKILRWNRNLEIVSGYSTAEISKLRLLEFFDAGEKQLMREKMAEGFIRGIIDAEFDLCTKSQKKIPCYFNGWRIIDEGKPCLIVMGVDVTERKKAEEKYSSVFQLSHEPMWIYDTEISRIILVNNASLEEYGFTFEEFSKNPITELFAPEVLEGLEEQLIIIQEKVQHSFESLHIRKNKSVFPVKIVTNTVKWDPGKIFYRVVNVEKIAGQHLVKTLIRINEIKYKIIVDASPDGILLIDPMGLIAEVSVTGLKLFGAIDQDEMVGKNFVEFIADESNMINKIINQAITGERVQIIELNLKRKNKEAFFAEISARMIQGIDIGDNSFLFFIRDISNRKKSEESRIHADRMVILGEMASGIAHEIYQPLNIISLITDKILFDYALPKPFDIELFVKKANKIFENINRIRNIIDTVMDFSRSRENFILVGFNINASIEKAALMLAEQFKHFDIKLDIQLDNNIPDILGNTFKFEQVIVNLLLNAKDALLEKKSKGEEYLEMIIGIRSYQQDHMLIVEVSDNGIGISNDDINNIMLPFYTTKEEGKGSGLGLSISYQIIKEMGGAIEITSEKNISTKVSLLLGNKKNTENGKSR